jgi:hypothetical protein
MYVCMYVCVCVCVCVCVYVCMYACVCVWLMSIRDGKGIAAIDGAGRLKHGTCDLHGIVKIFGHGEKTERDRENGDVQDCT